MANLGKILGVFIKKIHFFCFYIVFEGGIVLKMYVFLLYSFLLGIFIEQLSKK